MATPKIKIVDAPPEIKIVELALEIFEDQDAALDALIGIAARLAHITGRDRERFLELLYLNWAQLDGEWSPPKPD